jgi:hypothetical protein
LLFFSQYSYCLPVEITIRMQRQLCSKMESSVEAVDITGVMEWLNYPSRSYNPSIFVWPRIPHVHYTVRSSTQPHPNDPPHDTLSFSSPPFGIYTYMQREGMLKGGRSDAVSQVRGIADTMISFASKIRVTPSMEAYVPKECENAHAIHLRRTDKLLTTDHLHPHETTPSEHDLIMRRLWAYIDCVCSRRYPDENAQCTLYGDVIGRGRGQGGSGEDTGHIVTFFILSDDSLYKREFIAEMHRRNASQPNPPQLHIITFEEENFIPEAERSRYGDGAFAVFEFACMRRCKVIVQAVKYSTFSMFAAIAGQTKLLNLCNYTPVWILPLWMPCLDVYLFNSDGSRLDHYERVIDIDEHIRLQPTYGDISVSII